MPTVLTIDDDPGVLLALRAVVERQGSSFVPAATAADGLAAFTAARPDVVLCDLRLPDAVGLDLLRQLRQLDPTVPVLVITGHDTTDLAIEATAAGAFDFLPKPFSVAAVGAAVGRAVAAARGHHTPVAIAAPVARPGGLPALIGKCPAMQEVYKAIGRVARLRVTVLVLGESGTGKELVARAVHQHSGRADKPFLAVNCAAVPEGLLESELFGHEKGAFTGAAGRRRGRFEQADGGTLFLDEVGELTAAVQAKLLRVLQEQTFERVGGEETLHTDVRVIAATNADLQKLAADGRFRDDLYYRLAGYVVRLPPLRDRGNDLPLLVEHFLGQLAAELDRPVTGIGPDAAARLAAHPWPGNVRELQGVLRRAILKASGPVLTPDLFDLGPQPAAAPLPAAVAPSGDLAEFVAQRLAAGTKDLYAEWLARAEPELLQRVVDHFGGNLTRSAEALGLNRMTLRGRLRQYGLRSSDSSDSGFHPPASR